MIIESLELENIRSYESVKIDFPEGTSLLSGDIGSGKSSLLLAIEFALLGAKKSELPANLLLRHGTNQGSVRMQFTLENKPYVICRTLKRTKQGIKQDAGYLVTEGTKEDLMPEELRARMIHLLGYPEEDVKKSKDIIYRFTVYTPQELMKQILYEPAEVRKDTLRKIFGIDKYKRIRENAELYIKTLRAKIKVMQEHLQRDDDVDARKEANAKALTEIDEVLGEKAKAKKESEIKNTELEKRKDEKEKELHTFAEIEKEAALKDQMVKNLTESLQSHKKKQKNLDDQIAVKKKLLSGFSAKEFPLTKEQTKEQLKEMHEKHKQVLLLQTTKIQLQEQEKTLEELDKELQTYVHLEEELCTLQKMPLTDLKEKISQKEALVQKLMQESTVLQTKMQENTKLRDDMSKMSTCPTCKQDVDEDHKDHIKHVCNQQNTSYEQKSEDIFLELKQVKEELKEQKEEQESLVIRKEKIRHLQKEFEKKELVHKKIDSAKQNIQTHKQTLDKLGLVTVDNEKIKQLENMLDAMHTEELKLQERKTVEKRIEEMIEEQEKLTRDAKEIAKKITVANQELSDLQKTLEPKKKIEEEAQKLRTAYTSSNIALREIAVSFAEVQKEKEALLKQKEEIAKIIENKKKEEEKIVNVRTTMTWLQDYFTPLMSVMESHIMSTIYTQFNELFQKWFGILVEDESLIVQLDEDFHPLIEQNGYDTAVENLSGGERQALALAYRLGLNKVISDVVGHKTKDLIILDEPTEGFSNQQMDKIRDVLEELQTRQIIIVSHEPKLESYVQHVIRVEKQHHKSVIHV